MDSRSTTHTPTHIQVLPSLQQRGGYQNQRGCQTTLLLTWPRDGWTDIQQRQYWVWCGGVFEWWEGTLANRLMQNNSGSIILKGPWTLSDRSINCSRNAFFISHGYPLEVKYPAIIIIAFFVLLPQYLVRWGICKLGLCVSNCQTYICSSDRVVKLPLNYPNIDPAIYYFPPCHQWSNGSILGQQRIFWHYSFIT